MTRVQVILLVIAILIIAFGAWTVFAEGNQAGIVLLAGGSTVAALSAALTKKKGKTDAG